MKATLITTSLLSCAALSAQISPTQLAFPAGVISVTGSIGILEHNACCGRAADGPACTDVLRIVLLRHLHHFG